MAGRGKTLRIKGKCSCGMQKRSFKDLSLHARARNHEIIKMPRKSLAKGGE